MVIMNYFSITIEFQELISEWSKMKLSELRLPRAGYEQGLR